MNKRKRNVEKALSQGQRVEGTKRNLLLIDNHVWDMDTEKWIHVCPVCLRVFHSRRKDAVTHDVTCRQRWNKFKRALYGGSETFDEAQEIARRNVEFFNTQLEMEL